MLYLVARNLNGQKITIVLDEKINGVSKIYQLMPVDGKITRTVVGQMNKDKSIDFSSVFQMLIDYNEEDKSSSFDGQYWSTHNPTQNKFYQTNHLFLSVQDSFRDEGVFQFRLFSTQSLELDMQNILDMDDITNKIEAKAGTKIQSAVRGFFAKQAYKINHRPIGLCTDYPVYIRGNDPEIAALPSHNPIDQVALVGTSGLRTLKIACQLGSDCPKIFLIDNSQNVISFWKGLQQQIRVSSAVNEVLEKFTQLSCKCANSSEIQYIKELCEQYGFDKVKRIIMHATVILQDWVDTNTFAVINNVIKYHQYQHVYVYASNIVSYVEDEALSKKILKNIEILNYDLTIHTDLVENFFGYAPENVYYFSKNNIEEDSIYKTLTS